MRSGRLLGVILVALVVVSAATYLSQAWRHERTSRTDDAVLVPGARRELALTGATPPQAEIAELPAHEDERRTPITPFSATPVSGRVIYPDGTPVAGLEVRLLRPARVGDSESSPILLKDWSFTGDGSRHRRELDSVKSDERGHFDFPPTREGSCVVHVSAHGLEASSGVLALTSADHEGLELVLPRGGRLRGTLWSPGGSAWRGFRVGIEPNFPQVAGENPFTVLKRMRAASDAIRDVGADGRFELGPVPAGIATVYFYLPGEPSTNRQELGGVTMEEGVLLKRDFVVPQFPGTVSIRLLVNDQVGAGLEVSLSMTDGKQRFLLEGHTNRHGDFGPTHAFPGVWTIKAEDRNSGWQYDHPVPVLVSAAAESRAEMRVHIIEASLRFLDAKSGAPLANRSISLVGWASERVRTYAVWARRETDAEGRATWILTPGEYRFRLDAFDSQQRLFPTTRGRTANATWTLTGPKPDEIRL